MSHLARYNATPDAGKWTLVRQWMDEDPLPFGADLRANRPILETPARTRRARDKLDFVGASPARRLVEIKVGGEPKGIFARILRTTTPASSGIGFPELILNVGGLLIGAIETASQVATKAGRGEHPTRIRTARVPGQAHRSGDDPGSRPADLASAQSDRRWSDPAEWHAVSRSL